MFENTKKQGDWGLGAAIGYFTQKGITVSVPLTDSQDYDLVIDISDNLKKVQIKTTTYKRNNVYNVSLTVKGGNRSCSSIKKFDKTKVDYIFICVENGDKYLIPTDNISTQSLNLNDKYQIFKL